MPGENFGRGPRGPHGAVQGALPASIRQGLIRHWATRCSQLWVKRQRCWLQTNTALVNNPAWCLCQPPSVRASAAFYPQPRQVSALLLGQLELASCHTHRFRCSLHKHAGCPRSLRGSRACRAPISSQGFVKFLLWHLEPPSSQRRGKAMLQPLVVWSASFWSSDPWLPAQWWERWEDPVQCQGAMQHA